MASPSSAPPLFNPQRITRFLTSRKTLSEKWAITCTNKSHASSCTGLSTLNSPRSHSLPSFLSRRSGTLFSPTPIRPLFRPCLSSLRSSLTSMTTTSQATTTSAPQSSSSKTVRAAIKGRVQGVFYRNWTVENATQLGLKGWVRNRRDGSVEALFSGDSDKVQEMEQRCRRGPPDAMVTSLQVFPCNDDPGTGFERKPTV